jgi:hypothetical protein
MFEFIILFLVDSRNVESVGSKIFGLGQNKIFRPGPDGISTETTISYNIKSHNQLVSNYFLIDDISSFFEKTVEQDLYR